MQMTWSTLPHDIQAISPLAEAIDASHIESFESKHFGMQGPWANSKGVIGEEYDYLAQFYGRSIGAGNAQTSHGPKSTPHPSFSHPFPWPSDAAVAPQSYAPSLSVDKDVITLRTKDSRQSRGCVAHIGGLLNKLQPLRTKDLAKDACTQGTDGLVRSEAHFAQVLPSMLKHHPAGVRLSELKALVRRHSGLWLSEGVLGHNKLIRLLTCPIVEAVCVVSSVMHGDSRVFLKPGVVVEGESLMGEAVNEPSEPQTCAPSFRALLAKYKLPGQGAQDVP